MQSRASSVHNVASFVPNLIGISGVDRGIVMLIGIRAMPRLSTLLKSAALASVTAFAATGATAQDFTVYVYEKGFFPNTVYTDEATRIKFVNKTVYTVGVDTTSGSILINDIPVGEHAYLNVSTINGRTIKKPYVFGLGYQSGTYFEIESGAAPDS
jgi:hypothetical protein